MSAFELVLLKVGSPVESGGHPIVAELFALGVAIVDVASALHDVYLPRGGPDAVVFVFRQHPYCCKGATTSMRDAKHHILER